jgi:hypothetical protein
MFLSSLKSQIMDTEFTEAMAGTLNLPASLFKQSPGDRRRYPIGIGIDKIGKSTQYNLPNCF